MLQSGTSSAAVEGRLGWEAGRLNLLLDGPKGLSFEILLEILPVLDATPGDFFAQLYAYTPRNGNGNGDGAVGSHRLLDRRFEDSRRVVKAAITRRADWKQQRSAPLSS
jgi:hypothetical protein